MTIKDVDLLETLLESTETDQFLFEVLPVSDVRPDAKNNSELDAPTSSLNQYMRDINTSSLLSAQEEIHYVKLMKEGDQKARATLIESNLRLVVKIARSYMGRGLSFDDIISEGNCGLIHGIEKFDHERGCRLSTYVSIWIREFIEQAIMNQARTIRLPVHIIKEMSGYLKAGNVLSLKLGRKASEEEIAQCVKKPVEKVRDVLSYRKDASSINVLITSNSAKELQDIMPDERAMNPEEIECEDDIKQKLKIVFSKLDPMEQDVIRRRFSFGCYQDYQTLDAVSEAIGVARETVRQIQLSALKKLRVFLGEEGLTMEDLC